MKFGSWTYDGLRLDLIPERGKNMCDGDIKKFIRHGEWDLLSMPCSRNELVYACCPEPYPDVTYTMTLRRRHMFYFVNMIAPCFLISGRWLPRFWSCVMGTERLCHRIRLFIIETTVLYKDFQPGEEPLHEKIRYFFANQLLTRHSPLAPLGQVDEWTAKPSPFSIQGPLSEFFGLWLLKHWKIRIARRQLRSNFKIWKEKPKVTYPLALVMAFLATENENRQLEDLL